MGKGNISTEVRTDIVSKLLTTFQNSPAATAAIGNSITAGVAQSVQISTSDNISGAIFNTQAELNLELKGIIMSAFTRSNIDTSSIVVGYASSDYSRDVMTSNGVYYLTTNDISNITNKYVAYISYEDIVNNITDSISTIILNYGFVYSTILFQLESGSLVTTSMIGGPHVFAIDISVITGTLGTVGGSFVYNLLKEPSVDEIGVFSMRGRGWGFAADISKKLQDMSVYTSAYLPFIFETGNRLEFSTSANTISILNRISNTNIPAPTEPPSGLHGWNRAANPLKSLSREDKKDEKNKEDEDEDEDDEEDDEEEN